MRKSLLLLLLFALATSFTSSTRLIPIDTFLERVKAYSEEECLKSASFSIAVVDPQTGKLIAGLNENKSLATASTMKAITTATALMVLGENFTFETTVGHTGNIRNGVLEGDLIVFGHGDPSLGGDDFEGLLSGWVQKLKELGVSSITGNIIADPSFFPTQAVPDTWAWEDIGNYYGSGVFGLNIAQNTYRLNFKPGQEHQLAEVTGTDPEVPFIEFANEMKTGPVGSGDNGYIFGVPYNNLRYLRGSVPAGNSTFTIKGSLPDPPYFLAWHFHKLLQKGGVKVGGIPVTCRTQESSECHHQLQTILFRHSSKPLKDLVMETNHNSNNLFAEAIHRTLGFKLENKTSNEEACQAVTQYWSKKGIAGKGFHMEDGSGLSRFNAVTSLQMASVLTEVFQSPQKGAFELSLPVAGVSGTLKNVGKGSLAAGRIRAKSGFTQGVRAYCGYARTYKGKQLAFALMVNNHDCSYRELTKVVEKIFDDMVVIGITEK